VEHACEFCRISVNLLCSLNARCRLQNWSSIFSTSPSKNFSLEADQLLLQTIIKVLPMYKAQIKGTKKWFFTYFI